MRLRELLGETASAGATSAGNIAAVPNPHVAIGNVKKYGKGAAAKAPKTVQIKNSDGTSKNGLDINVSLFGGEPIKR